MTEEMQVDLAQHISKCLQLAVLLEVSSYPKPGNVHRTNDFKGTRYEHFLASAVAAAPHFEIAAERGIKVFSGEINPSQVGIGDIIKSAVASVSSWQSGGNTILGSLILLTPIAVAAGMTLAEERFSLSKLKENLKTVIESTTPEDAVSVYNAIEVVKPGGLGKAPKLDVTDPASKQRILKDEVNLFEVFKIASKYDSIASEWVNNYPITFDLGYRYFTRELEKTHDVNTATVHTFLKILSDVPDSLIMRKAGLAKAEYVSEQAAQALKIGGLSTQSGRDRLWKLDEELRDPDNPLNPGTTADITTAVLALGILEGYRP